MPIMQGRMKGKKWIVGAGEHGYWLGSYELSKRVHFEKEILPGTVVYDIGANVGFYSLLSAVLAGPEGQVYAFEPLPQNVTFIRRHVLLNKFDNIEIIEGAVSDQEGEAFFNLGASTAMGHLSTTGEILVKTLCLDAQLEAGKIKPPDYLKVDVEGAEYQVLHGAEKLIQTYRPTIFLDTHGREEHHATLALLSAHVYTFEILDGKPIEHTKELVARPCVK